MMDALTINLLPLNQGYANFENCEPCQNSRHQKDDTNQTSTVNPQKLQTTLQNSVTTVVRSPGFLLLCFNFLHFINTLISLFINAYGEDTWRGRNEGAKMGCRVIEGEEEEDEEEDSGLPS